MALEHPHLLLQSSLRETPTKCATDCESIILSSLKLTCRDHVDLQIVDRLGTKLNVLTMPPLRLQTENNS